MPIDFHPFLLAIAFSAETTHSGGCAVSLQADQTGPFIINELDTALQEQTPRAKTIIPQPTLWLTKSRQQRLPSRS